jgi:hypothetical protein
VRELGPGSFADGLSAGVHRVQWDLRHQPLPDSLLWNAGRLGGNAPFVLPGTYRVALTVDGRDAGTKSVSVSGDPLSVITDADRKLWHDVSLAVHQLQEIAGMMRQKVAAVSERFATVRSLMTKTQNPPPATRTSVDVLDRDLRTLRQQFAVALPGEAAPSGRGGGAGGIAPVPGQFGQVKNQLLASTSRPTDVQMRVAREARQDLVAAVESINRIISSTLPAVYQALGQPQLAPSLSPFPAVTINIP